MSNPCIIEVPTRVLKPLINDWLTRYRNNHKQEDANHEKYIVSDGKNGGALEVLAFHSGVSSRQLRRILNDNILGPGGTTSDYVSFDAADGIVCATVGALAWHEEPLNEFFGPFPVTNGELLAAYELPEGFSYEDMTKWQQTAYRKGLRDKALRMSA